MPEPSTAVRVISLTDAVERRLEFAKLAPQDSFAFFDAHTAPSDRLDYDPEVARRRSGRTIQPRELACYSSHYCLWQWFLETSYSQLLVFEDDVMVDWTFIGRLLAIDFAAKNIHFLRLFTKLPPRWTYIRTPYLTPYHHLIRVTGFAHGCQAYLLTRPGAELLVKKAQAVHYAIDMFLDRYWDHGLPDLALYPFPVLERGVASSIGDARLDRERLGWRSRLSYLQFRSRDKFEILRNRLGMDPQNFAKHLKL